MATILAYLSAIVRAFKTVFGLGKSGLDDANKQTKKLSTSVGGVSSGFSSAASAAKELKKTIAGFDELEILNSQDSGGGGGGGGVDVGGGGFDVDSYFDPNDWELPNTKDFEDKVAQFFENIKTSAERDENKLDWKTILGASALGGVIAYLLTKLKPVQTLIKKLKDLIKGFGAAWAITKENTAFGFFERLGIAIKGFIGAAKETLKIPNWFAPVTAALALLVAGFVTTYKKSEEFRDKVKSAVKVLVDYIKKVINDLWNNHLKNLWESIKVLVKSIVELLKTIMSTVKELWNNVLAPIFGYIAAGIATLVGGILAALTGLLSWIIG